MPATAAADEAEGAAPHQLCRLASHEGVRSREAVEGGTKHSHQSPKWRRRRRERGTRCEALNPKPTHDPHPHPDALNLSPGWQVVSYNVFVHACRAEGAWEAALEAMRWMREDGLPPDRVTFNSAIRVCRQAGKWAKVRQAGGGACDCQVASADGWFAWQAQEIFEEMQREGGVTPDSVTWSELIRGHTEAGQHLEAVGLFWRVRAGGERLTSLAYNAALMACARGRVGGEAERIWQDMREQRSVSSSQLLMVRFFQA